jgi:hypothetical protein
MTKDPSLFLGGSAAASLVALGLYWLFSRPRAAAPPDPRPRITAQEDRPMQVFMKECPRCQKMIPVSAADCDHCGGAATSAPPVGRVVLTRIQIPFWELVKTMVVWGIATVPALVVLYVLGWVINVCVLIPLGLGAAALTR